MFEMCAWMRIFKGVLISFMEVGEFKVRVMFAFWESRRRERKRRRSSDKEGILMADDVDIRGVG